MSSTIYISMSVKWCFIKISSVLYCNTTSKINVLNFQNPWRYHDSYIMNSWGLFTCTLHALSGYLYFLFWYFGNHPCTKLGSLLRKCSINPIFAKRIAGWLNLYIRENINNTSVVQKKSGKVGLNRMNVVASITGKCGQHLLTSTKI